jgi:hypothetical protein
LTDPRPARATLKPSKRDEEAEVNARPNARHDGEQRIVCELDPSVRTEERVLDALAACEEHDAELYIVWVVERGSVGLPAVLGNALRLAAERGIRATSAARFGRREVMLQEVARSAKSLASGASPTAVPRRQRRDQPRISRGEERSAR